MAQSDTQSSRVRTIDVARGLAIVGVVFNHTVLGLASAGIASSGSALITFNEALYLFRMAALVFLLGIFIPMALEKRGTTGYFWHRLPLLVWLYIVWYLVQGAVELAASDVKNSPVTWVQMVEFWVPPAQLWFLPFLIVATVAIGVCTPWMPTFRGRLALVACVVMSVLAWGWLPNIAGLRGLPLLGFAAIGAALGLRRFRTATGGHLVRWLGVGLSSMGAFLALNHLNLRTATGQQSTIDLTEQIVSFFAAGFGVLMLVSAAALLARVPRVSAALGYLGRRTLQVFVAHIIVTAGVRISLLAMGVGQVEIHVVAAVMLGILVPIAVAEAAPRIGLSWLFATPIWVDRIAAKRSRATTM